MRLEFEQDNGRIHITIVYDLETLAATMVVTTKKQDGSTKVETTPCRMDSAPAMNAYGFDIQMSPVGKTNTIVYPPGAEPGDAPTGAAPS